MKYATAAAFRAAIEARLKVTGNRAGMASIARRRKQMVFDRLLARLLIVAPDRWVVKGGFALDLRLGDRARMTKDLDLSRGDNAAAAAADLLAAQSLDLGDFFSFTIERTGGLDAAHDGTAVRYHVTANLAGRRFEDAILDIAFGDPLPMSSDRLAGPDLFGFAGLEPIEVPALPLEQHLAEKVHAYTRLFGAGGSSSRVRDLVDLVLIRSVAAFEAGRVRDELIRTFTARATHAIPNALPLPPPDWRIAYRNLASTVDLAPDISAGHALAAAFLDPVLVGEAPDEAHWDPVSGDWHNRA